MHYIECTIENRLGYITLNRPDKRNALNFDVVAELKKVLVDFENNPEVKIIIIKANGKAFCAGADLAYLESLQKFSYEENVSDSKHLMELYKLIYTLNKVVIAQVEGHALAGGCGLVTVCDFVFSIPEAKFGYTETKIGFVPAIVMVFLIRKIGEAKAKALLLTADLIEASDAFDLGIVTNLVKKENIEREVRQFALALCEQASGASLGATKKMIAEVQSLTLDDALDFACHKNAEARNAEDCKKGIRSFLSGEKLSW